MKVADDHNTASGSVCASFV